jgi:uncharacterized membrane protein YphA (DoxX/SURF4 family)
MSGVNLTERDLRRIRSLPVLLRAGTAGIALQFLGAALLVISLDTRPAAVFLGLGTALTWLYALRVHPMARALMKRAEQEQDRTGGQS